MQWLAQNWMWVVMFPIPATMYARLAKREEQDAVTQFGHAYRQYIQQVPAFIPHLSGKRAGGMEHQEKSTHG